MGKIVVRRITSKLSNNKPICFLDINPVIFFDSGIGGLPYYQYFCMRNPEETVVYVADRVNFPYGPKSKETLVDLLVYLVSQLVCLKPKLMVAACNTASVSALPALREAFPAFPFVGTVPAIKPAVIESVSRRVGVLGTDRTIDDPYIAELAAKYGADVVITSIAAPDLVEFTENRGIDVAEVEKQHMVSPYIERFRNAGADAVVLGCTHFLLLLDVFRDAASPDIKIYESIEGVSRRAEAILDEGNLRATDIDAVTSGANKNLFLLTGSSPIEQIWRQRALSLNMDIRLLNDVSNEYEASQ
jgi:glutamate racemase